MSDITNQSNKFNSVLKEKRIDKKDIKNIIDKTNSKEDEEVDRAMRIYDRFLDIIIDENATMREAYLITAAIAESIYYYSLFGDE